MGTKFPGYRVFDSERARNLMLWIGAMVSALHQGAEVYSVRTRKRISI